MKVLIIAGGLPQIELIRQLKSRGCSTVLLDGSPAAVARPYADTFYCVNIFDIDAVEKIAREEQADLLLTVCADQVLLVVAEVSERLGLPCYIDYKTAQDVSDKLKMKRIFNQNSIPTTDYVQMDTFSEEKLSRLHYPLVVKPVDAYSSKGVRKAEDLETLRRYYEEARAISRSGGVIVEEYFSGEEISVDAFVVNGQARLLLLSASEKVKDKDRFVIFRGRCPVKVPPEVYAKIEEIAQKIADGFGLKNAPLLIQLLHNGKDVSVLEFCARTGGNMKYLLIKYAAGVDVIKATVDITLGQTPDIAPKDTGFPIVVNDFIYCEPGILDHFEGFSEMEAAGYIHEFHPNRQKGFEARGVTSSSDRVAGMNIVAKDIAEYNRKKAKILASVKVIDSLGRDIMRRDLLPDLEEI